MQKGKYIFKRGGITFEYDNVRKIAHILREDS